jgi:hypothetical protein
MEDSTDLIIGIIGAVIAGITAIFLWYQIHQQTKIQSATFAMDFLDRTGTKYSDLLDKVKEKEDGGTDIVYEPKKIRKMLNHFEYMASLEQDGLIKINHIDEMFGQALLRLKRDTDIMTILNGARDKDKTIYSNILLLFDKISKRH